MEVGKVGKTGSPEDGENETGFYIFSYLGKSPNGEMLGNPKDAEGELAFSSFLTSGISAFRNF